MAYGKTGFETKAEYEADRYRKIRAEKLLNAPPDPILSLNSNELAYIAGLLDGEGCIRIGRVGPKKVTYYPSVAIGMTHRGVIEWLQEKLHSGSIKLNNPTSLRRNPKWKPQSLIRIHGKRAKLLCEQLLPFLIVKKPQAELVSQFPCDVRRGPNNPIPQGIQETRERLRDAMTKLNKRG